MALILHYFADFGSPACASGVLILHYFAKFGSPACASGVLILPYFAEFGSFRAPLHKKWLISHREILSREMS